MYVYYAMDIIDAVACNIIIIIILISVRDMRVRL